MPTFNLAKLERFDSIGTLIHRPEMASTSDLAKETLLNGVMEIPLPLLVLCERQTAGRGQLGKSWQSGEHSLTFTWCLPVETIPTANQPVLPLIAGVSVCEAIDSIGIRDAKLKWPNDVLIDRKKIGGILVERIASAKESWFLIGIGINVNQSEQEIASMNDLAFALPPGSLKAHNGKLIELQTLLLSVIDRLAENTSKETCWNEDYKSRFEFLSESIEFTKPNGEAVSGVFKGVDATGRIRLEVDGKLQLFASGQLRVSPN